MIEDKRKEEMLKMRLAGKSLAEIGRQFLKPDGNPLTKQRVYQILKDYQFKVKYIIE